MGKKSVFVLWLTGLSASGKTTIAKALQEELAKKGMENIKHLDGDEVRKKLEPNLGFSKEDRDKNIVLAVELAKEHQNQGSSVIASFISPYKEQRKMARHGLSNFIEVFVDAPLEVCEQRDPKGLYKKARSGEIQFFTGISDPYERSENPEIHLETERYSVGDCVKKICTFLDRRGFCR